MYNPGQHITENDTGGLLRAFLLEAENHPEVQKALEIQTGFLFSEKETVKKLPSNEAGIVEKLAKAKGYVNADIFNKGFFVWIFSFLFILIFLFFSLKYFLTSNNEAKAHRTERQTGLYPNTVSKVIMQDSLSETSWKSVVFSKIDSAEAPSEKKVIHKKNAVVDYSSHFPFENDYLPVVNKNKKDDNYLNLDFESTYPDTRIPEVWWILENSWNKSDYKTIFDSSYYFSGKNSIKLEYAPVKNSTVHFGSVSNEIPSAILKGKSKIEITAAIKVGEKDWDKVYIYCSRTGKKSDTKSLLKYFTATSSNKDGVQIGDWKRFTIELPLDSVYGGVNFGGYYLGKDTAWFDAFEIKIDGEYFEDIKPVYEAPKDKEIVWLNKNCIPLKSLDANGENKDLLALDDMIGNASIVGIDNSSLCSAEVFGAMNKLIKYLVEEKKFGVIALYAGMPEVYPINNYIQTGEGKLEQMLDSLQYWYWNTKEMAGVIDWMKNYNLSGKGKIVLYGIDFWYKNYVIENIRNFGLEYDQKLASILDKLEKVTKKLNDKKTKNAPSYIRNKLDQWEPLIEELYAELEMNEKTLVNEAGKTTTDWIKQNVNILKQYYKQTYTRTFYNATRCTYLKNNIDWIKKQNPGSKMILLSFGQLTQNNEEYWLGYHLQKAYGDSLYTMVMTSETGDYIAYGDSALTLNKLSAPYKGTFEFYFEKCDTPDFILDLKKASSSDSASAWLTEKLFFRYFFGLSTLRQFALFDLRNNYDAVINLRNSTAADCYRIGKKRPK